MDEQDNGSELSEATHALRSLVVDTLRLVTTSESDHLLILDMALADAGERFNPANPAQYALFIGGPLHQAVSETLGPRAANEVQTVLDPILSDREIEESGVHRMGDSERPAAERVLLASAQRSAREAFGDALEAHGFPVQTCVDGAAITFRCWRARPGVIVADLDWLDAGVASMLCSMADAPPLVLLTSDPNLRSTVATVLHKPVTADVLIGALEPSLPHPTASRTDEWEDEEEMPVFEEDTFVSSTMKRLAYEALDSVASPNVRNGMLSEALDRAKLYDLPVDPVELGAWLTGPLLEVVGEVLGDEVAETLLAELQPVLVHAAVDEAYSSWEEDAEQTPPSRRGLKGERTSVVVVDDDPAVLASLERQLGQRGYEVRIEYEAQMAITLCTDRLPTVVIAAAPLPDASGRELATLLKLTFGDDAPALVLLAGSGHEPETIDNVAHVLRKPVDLNQLCELIDALREAGRRTGQRSSSF